MLKLILYIVSNLSILVLTQGDNSMGEGLWSMTNIGKCEEELENGKVHVDIKSHRINRTHDGISATVNTDIDIGNTTAVLITVCKYTDGGCKQYQIITDNSVVTLAYKYAKNNVQKGLALAGLDPADFPVVTGEYEVEDFVMDYCELPAKGVYGRFEAEVFLVQDSEKAMCVKVALEFTKPDDDENLC